MSLFVQDPKQSVIEGDFGEFSEVTSCLSAILSQPLNRAASFLLIQPDSSTAIDGLDFEVSSLSITVPGDFSGEFTTCISFLIIGDTLFEGNETILYEIVPQVAVDAVFFPGSITVNILDNDGMFGIAAQSCIFLLVLASYY